MNQYAFHKKREPGMCSNVWKTGCLAMLLSSSALAVDFVWDNSEGDNDYANPLNWVGDSYLGSETAIVDLDGAEKAVLSSGSPSAIDAIHIGYAGGNGEFEQTGGTLSAAASASAISRVGSGSGKTGTWTMSGGSCSINTIQLGLDSGTGNLFITGGDFVISRAKSDYSLQVGSGGSGNFEISGGSFNTRGGVKIASGSTFAVSGSAASTLGIGSQGTSVDGRWVHEAGGILRVEVDATPVGVSKIYVDEVDGTVGTSWDGNVTFEAGALLDVSFLATTNPGTFTVMEWVGDVTDNGLAFASSVDTNVWSFEVDAVNKKLTVTAAGTVPDRFTVTVNSFAGLMSYLDADKHDVTMSPGTYRVTPDDVTSGLFSSTPMLEFTGTNSVFDFTDVTFEFETEVFQSYGSVGVTELAVSGEDLVIKNLTMTDIGNTRPSKTALGVLLDGSRNRIEGLNLTVRGSYPYGYGDIFGKGSGYVIKHFKHSAILVRGEGNHLLNCKVFHRAYGHGIFCQGSQNAIIEGCYVEGETRTTDDVLAEAGSGSGADGVGFVTNWGEDENGENGYVLPAGWMFSCQEDGIRAYNLGLGLDGVTSVNTTDMTVIDCTVNKMRNGVTIGFCDNTKYVENCVAVGTEMGYWVGSNGEVVDCAGDAAYGPLVKNSYQNNRDTVVDLTVLDNSARYGNTVLSYMGGSSHNVTFRGRNEYVDPNLTIMLAGILTGMRQYVVNPTYNDFSTTNIELFNYTQYPVVMAAKSSGTTGVSGGTIEDNGSGNSLTPISENTLGGFGVIQTIEAEDFSVQSGASIQSLGDGVQFMGAAADGDWICFEDFFFGSGPNRFEARVSGGDVDGSIELRLNAADGTLIGTCAVASNEVPGSWGFETVTLDEPRGKHDVYLVFKGGAGALPSIDRFRFYVDFPGRKESRGLVGHWTFDDGSGSAATDSSGYGNHGTMANASWVSGKKGGALDFNGSSSTVSIPINAFETIEEEVTIAFWAYGDAAQPVNNSIFYASAGGARALNIHLPYSNSNIYWDAGNADGYDRIYTSASAAEFEGSWAHWVFTKNSNTGHMRIYRNGVVWHSGHFNSTSGSAEEITGITAAAIGSQIGGSACYNGMIDDVRLYDIELMEHEVAELYNSYSYTDAGTPHSWLDSHGLVTGGDYEAAALQDADGDGLLNEDEFAAGTDPMNSASVFRILEAGAQGTEVTLDWSSVTGKTYDVWFSTNLADGVWTLVDENVQGQDPSCTTTMQVDGTTGYIKVEVK